jgi:PEP-CTERM motif
MKKTLIPLLAAALAIWAGAASATCVQLTFEGCLTEIEWQYEGAWCPDPWDAGLAVDTTELGPGTVQVCVDMTSLSTDTYNLFGFTVEELALAGTIVGASGLGLDSFGMTVSDLDALGAPVVNWAQASVYDVTGPGGGSATIGWVGGLYHWVEDTPPTGVGYNLALASGGGSIIRGFPALIEDTVFSYSLGGGVLSARGLTTLFAGELVGFEIGECCVVPEPASMTLFGLGIAAMLMRRVRRRLAA